VILFHSLDLPWTYIQGELERLKRLLVIFLGVVIIGGIIIPFIPVPKKDLSKEEKLPPRLAQLVLQKKEKPKPPPPKKVEKKKEEKKKEKKPKKKKVEKKKPKPKKKVVKKVPPKPEKTQAQKMAEARKKAQKSGLLAFADELADLRDKKVDAALNKNKKLSKGAAKSKKFDRNILTSNVTVPAGSGGIDTSALSKGMRSDTKLAGRETTKVESDVIAQAAAASKGKMTAGGGNKPRRTNEEVTLVFDRNKGAIYALYNRALRRDPTIAGKIVFQLTIAADGSVTDVKILSSELNNPALEHKLVIKIKSFVFEPKSGADKLIVTYPLDFVPS
jgi:protein TonB